MSRILIVLAVIGLSPTIHATPLLYDFAFGDPAGPNLAGSFTADSTALDDSVIAKSEIQSLTSSALGFSCCNADLSTDTGALLDSFLFQPISQSISFTIRGSQPALDLIEYKLESGPDPTTGEIVGSISVFSIPLFLEPSGVSDQVDLSGGEVVAAEPVPVPATLALSGLGLAYLGVVRRKRNAQR